ncbi:MAG: FAD-dependent monooxygenase [Acidiferrobacteraceae bacterium]
MSLECDVLIAGGGMTGTTLALALARSPLGVTVVEARSAPETAGANDDDRSLTLSQSSRRLFDGIGVWPALAACGPALIREIQVTDSGALSGTVHLDARELCVEALGYVFENRRLGTALAGALASDKRITLLSGARVSGYSNQGSHLRVHVAQGDGQHEINCRLLVASDGTHSCVRELAHITAHTMDYGQTAFIAGFMPEFSAPGVAFERFTPSGPVAVLPRSNNRCGVVLTVPTADAERMNPVSPLAVRELAERRFGRRLGQFQEFGVPQSFPLRRVLATALTAPRVALVGNAAHTLHPVAAQGLNLGLRDVAVLAELLEDCGTDPGRPSLLEDYERRRRRDVRLTSSFTHALVRIFSNHTPGLGVLRGIGLALIDAAPPVKAMLALRSMGLSGRLPPLLQEHLT